MRCSKQLLSGVTIPVSLLQGHSYDMINRIVTPDSLPAADLPALCGLTEGTGPSLRRKR